MTKIEMMQHRQTKPLDDKNVVAVIKKETKQNHRQNIWTTKMVVAVTKKEARLKQQTKHLDDKNVVAVIKIETKQNHRS